MNNNEMNRFSNSSVDEKLAITGALDLMHSIFELFRAKGIDGRDGLMKAVLRGTLFMIEESNGTDLRTVSDALLLFLLDEFRQDQQKP